AGTPRRAALPMGSTWSLWIAQMIDEDRGPPLVARPWLAEEADEIGYYARVDNLGAIGVCEKAVGRALEQLEGGFNREGLLLHKSELSRAGIVALGAELDGAALRARVAPKRIWNVYAELGALLRRERASAWSVQAVLGHCVFAALCCRRLLGVFHSVRAFVEHGRASGRAEPLWGECRAELRVFRPLVIFMADSSLEGCAVAQASWPLDASREVGRTSERKRIRRVGWQADGGWSVAAGADERGCDEPPSETARDLEVDRSFPEVPASHASLASQRRATLRPQDVQLALRDRLGCSRQELGLPETDEQLSRAPALADVGASSGTDDEAGPGPGAARRAVLRRAGHQRRCKFLGLALATPALGASAFLEQSSVTPKVLERRLAEVGGFVHFAGGRWGANKGEQVLAGPSLPEGMAAPGAGSQSAEVTAGPRAGIAWRLVERGSLQMAAFPLVSLSICLRPLWGMGRRGIIAPAAGISPFWNLLLFPSQHAERSKTVLSDVSIVLDSPCLQFLGPILRALADGPREESVWAFAHPQCPMDFKAALAELEIGETIAPHQTRRSGSSIDIARPYRAVSEAQRRGQWASVKSAQRCEKDARLGARWEQLSAPRGGCSRPAKQCSRTCSWAGRAA
ncbi:unnamed protein product, partial [Prorocentrum cordatum]